MFKPLLHSIVLLLVAIQSQAFNITFKVNMQNETGFTNPAVAGNFNGWCGDCNYMSDVNGDNIWETTIDIPAGGLEYNSLMTTGLERKIFKQARHALSPTLVSPTDI